MRKLNTLFLKNQRGFTLVELVVVLAIVGILTVGSAALFKEQKVNVFHEVTAGKLETVKLALLTFVEKQRYLPCPDATAQGQAGFGMGNRQLNQSASFTVVPATQGISAQAETALSPFVPAVPATPAIPARTVSVDTCAVSSGTVPFEAIGLTLTEVTDAKGNLFRYVVNQGVTAANHIANCPVDSACFFNQNSPPAFNSSTEPVSGSLGGNNLRICSGLDCAGVNLLGDGLIAVLLAYNKHTDNGATGLSAEEQENLDGDKTFIKSQYVGVEGDTYFDDQLVSISGTELKRGDMRKTYQKNSVGGDNILSGNDILGLGGDTSSSGMRRMMRGGVEWEQVNQTFDFGAAAANTEIVLTYNTYAVGSWNQSSGGGMGGHHGSSSDAATVVSNGVERSRYQYDYTDNTQSGVVPVSFIAQSTGNIESQDQYGNVVTLSVTAGELVNTYADYWSETTELIVQTDANGQIDLEFAAGTTDTTETIDFTNIELVYYNTPSAAPDFPTVEPISGISQTEGL